MVWLNELLHERRRAGPLATRAARHWRGGGVHDVSTGIVTAEVLGVIIASAAARMVLT